MKKILHSSGVVPVDIDGDTPDDIGDQAALVWNNIREILSEANMGLNDIVSVVTYVVAGQDLQSVMRMRDSILQGHTAASTLVTVPELAQKDWKMEIAIVAIS